MKQRKQNKPFAEIMIINKVAKENGTHNNLMRVSFEIDPNLSDTERENFINRQLIDRFIDWEEMN
jgi:hypothetical protein